MRVSDYYKLGRTQPTLDFVDVDIQNDVRLYVNPRAIRLLPSVWGAECTSLIQSFFGSVLTYIRAGDHQKAVELLQTLREPNETHLGLSVGQSRGRGLGTKSANDVWASFAKSKAVTSGLLQDLEDTVLLIDGISVDIVSDIVTNIIRGPLIKFTQETAKHHNMLLVQNVESGPIWSPQTKQWINKYVDLPVTSAGKLLLVPKIIVRQNMDYNVDQYYRHYIMTHLQQVEIDANSSLVEIIKTGKNKGTPKVTKKKIEKKYKKGKSTKATVREQTEKAPSLFKKYKTEHDKPSQPLTHGLISDLSHCPKPDWDKLLGDVISIPTGKPDAYRYEDKVEALLSALFYPNLTNPIPQQNIHDGRKRIDIQYTNMASQGFFKWLASHYPTPHVFFECKNYGNEIGNPELDQIAGRFSPSRGQFGIIVCRQFKNKDRFIQRCKDTCNDKRGYIIPLDDEDLKLLVQSAKTDLDFQDWNLLKQRFDNLIM